MNNETFTVYKYAIYHKPTQKWAKFGNHNLEFTVRTIELVKFEDCFITKNIDWLERYIKTSVFNDNTNYCIDNYLEFEFVKVKATYTIEE